MFGHDPELPGGFQDADLEMAEMTERANRAARLRRQALAKAAPELLQACKTVIAWNMTAATEREWNSYRLAVVEQVRAAIAKAEPQEEEV